LSEAQVKAQQALAISFSATTIAMNAQKLAGDLKLIQDRLQVGLTRLITVSVGKETTAKAANAVATGTATVAQRALNAAMNANPIILLITGLAALTAGLFLFTSSTGDATDETISFSDRTKNLNDELDRQDSIQRDIISSRKELIRLAAIENSLGKTEEERLQIKLKLSEELNELEVESIEKSIGLNNDKLKNLLSNDIFSAESNLQYYNELSKLQDFDLNKSISTENQKLALITKTYKEGGITLEEYYKSLIEFRKLGSNADENEIKSLESALDKIDSLNRKLEIANKKKVVDDKVTNDQISDFQTKAFERRRIELERFAVSQESVLKKIKDIELKNIQDIERFRLESESKGIFDINRKIDIITRLAEIELQAEIKRITDVSEQQIKSINLTIKNEEDRNKKIEQLNLATADAIFRSTELSISKRNQTINEEILAEEKRAKEIKFIYDTLYEEITFGDQNVTNTLANLAIRRNQIEINSLRDSQNFERLRVDNKIETAKLIFDLELQSIEDIRTAQAAQARSERKQQLDNTKQSYIDKYGEAFFQTEKGIKILSKLEENLNTELNTKLLEIDSEFSLKRKNLERELIAEKTALVQEFIQFTATSSQLSVDLFSSLSDLSRTNRENELIDLRTSNNERLNILNEQYNAELELQQQQLERGLINQDQYNSAIVELDKNRIQTQTGLEQSLRDQELKAKKKSFEDEKKLRIASTVIAGAQGALQAFATAFQLGPILGPVVGGALAALVGATTGVQIAAIKRQKFDDSGSIGISSPNPSGAGPLGGAGGGTPGSSGGFTRFDESLLGPQSGAPGSGDGGSGDPMRVYVLESDITNTQNRVNVAESNATFG
jgi:hypothetical protein